MPFAFRAGRGVDSNGRYGAGRIGEHAKIHESDRGDCPAVSGAMGLGARAMEHQAEGRAIGIRFPERLMMRRTAKELAEAIGARMEGDGVAELGGVAAPERAGAHDLIYVESAKHAQRAAASAAMCAIAAEGIALPGKTVLRSAQPKVAFARAAELLLARTPIASGIHPTAIVAPLARVAAEAGIGPYAVIGEDAYVGAGTQIGAHSVIGAGCWIGENCRIHPRVTLYGGVRLGSRVEIHSGAVIGADGFGYAFGEGKYWKFPQAGIGGIEHDVGSGAEPTVDLRAPGDTR